MSAPIADPVRIGIAGLGQAGAAMVPTIERHAGMRIAAAVEPNPDIRSRFARDFQVPVHAAFEALCAEPSVELVYIATPTKHHADHTLTALAAGKHVIVEKPMAANLGSAAAMVAATKEAGRQLITGHSQSFEPPIRAMRRIVASGDLGRVRAAHTLLYSDWLLRPRLPEELDTALGGGVLFRQGAHQVDLLRWIGGGVVRSVRASAGAWTGDQNVIGAYTLFLDFEDGTVATAVFNGYGRFNSAELTFGAGESGRQGGLPNRSSGTSDAAQLKHDLGYGGARSGSFTGGESGFYGVTLVSCEGGDIRQVPGGLAIYTHAGRREVPVAPTPTGRDALLDEAFAAVRLGVPPAHDGRWGLANLEVCAAALESARTRREVELHMQVPTPGDSATG